MKKTIELSLETAKNLYGKNPEMDQLLLNNFTISELTKKSWQDIKTFEDACDAIGEDIDVLNKIFNCLSQSTIAYIKLEIIYKAINGDWVIDWSNRYQRKWYPYFTIEDGVLAGLLCAYANFSATYALTSLGGRLYAQSEEKSKHISKHFIKLYRQYIVY